MPRHLSLGLLVTGGVFTIVWNGTNWTYNGATITTRPSSRTDVRMISIGGTTSPSFGLANDLWFEDLP